MHNQAVEMRPVVRRISFWGLWTEGLKKHPDCCQQQVPKPGSVVGCGFISVLGKCHLFIFWWGVLRNFTATYEDHIFSRDIHAYFSKIMVHSPNFREATARGRRRCRMHTWRCVCSKENRWISSLILFLSPGMQTRMHINKLNDVNEQKNSKNISAHHCLLK